VEIFAFSVEDSSYYKILKHNSGMLGKRNLYQLLWILNVIPAASGTIHIYVTCVAEQWDYENIWTWKA
jgi:hypothetical protein